MWLRKSCKLQIDEYQIECKENILCTDDSVRVYRPHFVEAFVNKILKNIETILLESITFY